MLRGRAFIPSALGLGRLLAAVLLGACWPEGTLGRAAEPAGPVRFATFNVSLYGRRPGEVLRRLKTGADPQARHLAEIVQRVRPDVLLLNEIDYDADGATLRAFCEHYLAVGQNTQNLAAGPAEPIEYSFRFAAASNTGVHSGLDLNRDGVLDPTPGSDAYAADCWGYGRYQGQYGMAILSKLPIDASAVRTFRNFRWKDMPGARLPDDQATATPGDWYAAEALAAFPLSSKSHWDVPIVMGGQRVHVLASHPTPPVFDGAEDRNGRRNHDEIRFWADYVNAAGASAVGPSAAPPKENGAEYIYDDSGRAGHLPAGERFVILGDLNGDPLDGDGREGIALLLASPRVLRYPPPRSVGAAEQSRGQGGENRRHRGDPACDTCDPPDAPGPGNLRIDYVLPSSELRVTGSGVFWPPSGDPLFGLVGVHPFPSSDHRLVWADVEL